MEKYDSVPSLTDQSSSYKVFTVLVIISQVLAVVIACMVGGWMGQYGFSWSDTSKVFSYHPLFMILGFIVLYGHSILVYRLWRKPRKMYVKILHAALHGLAIVFISVGLKAVFDSHNLADPPIPNLYSLHSWMGILTVALFAGQWLAGFLTFLLPFCSQAVRACVKPFHVYGGIAIFLLAVATALVGINEKMNFTGTYKDLHSDAKLANSIGILLLIFTALMMFIVINPNYRRPAEEELSDEEQRVLPLSQ